MTDAHHVFVTEAGFYSSRWETAFGNARIHYASESVTAEIASRIAEKTTLVWILTGSPGWEPMIRDSVAAGALVIAMSRQPSVDDLRAALTEGARGYVHAVATPERLRQAAETVLAGGLWLPADVINSVLRVLASTEIRPGQASSGDEDDLASLTDRERRVAEAVQLGLSNKEVARQLDITERTVKAHLSAAFRKLDVRDRMQLAARMRRANG
ncbi:response regulator transcription factor [Spiribacter vilamensis]|uniref:Regulatory LuxR family protein n=1 Tax=Spiribacter vilamensis TaxID=531306 RepID=A0A4V2GJ51_9GAMM|nr:response regulator transcription factor [Spiribacter vilamensis]RZU98915.1 regulatory LuxR family protein [Spiribacter vilamensis]TVO62075.1 response regulator transcription factor [Spiribacter vilamensis]